LKTLSNELMQTQLFYVAALSLQHETSGNKVEWRNMMKKLPVVKIALGALLFGLLPATMPAHADGISINVPGLSISIGQRDNRGYYWDGYDWRSPYWWQHRNEYYGHRNDRGYYWDGARWRDGGWWNQHGRGGPDHGHDGGGRGDHGGGDHGHGGDHGGGQPRPPMGGPGGDHH
jgi:hypothetical protein